MFQIGDLAVYPAHGVGRIESIEQREISGDKQDFYIMRILENDMIIMIPVENVQHVGLRNVITKKEVKAIYGILKERKARVNSQTWNRRYRDYMDKIKTGALSEVAQVLRDLCLLKGDKELSFGERKMLDTARNLLVKEISIATKVKEGDIEKNIAQMLSVSDVH
ncbi:MAG: CarD family transcriptional regulator [Proteobacteria bacterium]|nr:CarD family transcriptional regulator [Pseudomonadota bacterium]